MYVRIIPTQYQTTRKREYQKWEGSIVGEGPSSLMEKPYNVAIRDDGSNPF